MRKSLYKIISIFILFIVALEVDFPIEFQAKIGQIIFDHLILLFGLLLIIKVYKLGQNLNPPFNWFSHFINSFFFIIILYMTVVTVFIDLSGSYSIWSDKKMYINQKDPTQIIVEQENRISGSIIDYRVRKVKPIIRLIRWTHPSKMEDINGRWRLIDIENNKDTIANFTNGIY